jgi:hypothetical protein
MTVSVAHAHAQRLVSVVKMTTVLEECTNEEKRSVVRFCGQKDSMQRILVKKCFLFTVGNVSHVKGFTTRLRNSFQDVRNVADDAGAEVAETTVKRLLCCGFRRASTAAEQVYQCWWRICREMFSPRFEYNIFYVLYPFVTYLLTQPRVTYICLRFHRT